MAGYSSLSACSLEGRESQAVVSDLDGILLRSSSHFPYYMLAAWEAPVGFVRFIVLLLLWPVIWLLQRFVSHCAAIKLMAWVAFVGVREADIISVAHAVLPKFYAEDVNPETWRIMSSFGRRYLLTANPRIIVEPFAREHLAVDSVLGPELEIHPGSGRATGFLRRSSLRQGRFKKKTILRERFGNDVPDVALGDGESDADFLAMCKEGYTVSHTPPTQRNSRGERRYAKLSRPVVFHDGRLVRRPTPMFATFVLLWLPFGLILGCLRAMVALWFPFSMRIDVLRALGIRISVKGDSPDLYRGNNADFNRKGILFASGHRSLLDPVLISFALRRPVPAVIFSLSRVSEVVSPIPTIRLTRNKEKDASIMKKHLENGDLVVCPEGTTCREPFLLRFSGLFAELSSRIVPVATNCDLGMFHATTARGFKGLDSLYFYLNPMPSYEITFCEQLPEWMTCAGGRAPHEVANFVQSILASKLGFKCTTFTRKDKYRALVGNDDIIGRPS